MVVVGYGGGCRCGCGSIALPVACVDACISEVYHSVVNFRGRRVDRGRLCVGGRETLYGGKCVQGMVVAIFVTSEEVASPVQTGLNMSRKSCIGEGLPCGLI